MHLTEIMKTLLRKMNGRDENSFKNKQNISSFILQVPKMFKYVLLMTLADNMLLQNTKIRGFNFKQIICYFKISLNYVIIKTVPLYFNWNIFERSVNICPV